MQLEGGVRAVFRKIARITNELPAVQGVPPMGPTEHLDAMQLSKCKGLLLQPLHLPKRLELSLDHFRRQQAAVDPEAVAEGEGLVVAQGAGLGEGGSHPAIA